MKKILLAALMLGVMTGTAAAVDPAGGAAGSGGPSGAKVQEKQLTVRDAIGLLNGLKRLDSVPSGQIDKDGNQVMAPTNFKFSGSVMMTIAINMNHAQNVLTNYSINSNAIIRKLSNGAATVPDDKKGEYLELDAKAGDAPAGEFFSHIKEADLCLEVKPPQ